MTTFTLLVEGSGQTISAHLTNLNVPVHQLKEYISYRSHLNTDEFHLSHACKYLRDELLLSDYIGAKPFSTTILQCQIFALAAGKGGFGSLLRGQGKQFGQKKATNFDAMRDLNGRRIRTVNAEKNMEEWLKGQDEKKKQEWQAKQEEKRQKKEQEEQFIHEQAEKMFQMENMISKAVEAAVKRPREEETPSEQAEEIPEPKRKKKRLNYQYDFEEETQVQA